MTPIASQVDPYYEYGRVHPTLLVTGDPTAQKDEYFTRSLFWSNDDDWKFDGSPASSLNPTYGIFSTYEVLMHNVATLENPSMASCSLWPSPDFPCTSVDVRRVIPTTR